MTEHELKAWPQPFEAVRDGSKLHEVRHDDRGFEVGDVLHLREFDPTYLTDYQHKRYTGRALRRRVTHKTPGGTHGLPSSLCVLSIVPLVAVDVTCPACSARAGESCVLIGDGYLAEGFHYERDLAAAKASTC
jgi:hypothetical protein